ncbi:MAG: acyl-CoA dehydrogenase family protein [Chroococcales cyanobacterium]
MQLIEHSERKEQQSLLDIAESYLKDSVAPIAAQIDTNVKDLAEVFQGLGDRNLLALRLPKSFGGAELDELTFRQFQVLITSYSGALAFLQTQHQSAGSLIYHGTNEALKQQYLPRMGNGEILVGVGFSQLRRKGKPMLQAIPEKGGYRLVGNIPWVTGLSFFHSFIAGATLPDGKAIYGIVPFQETKELDGKITFSEPMQLMAMASTNTVSATLENWFLSSENVIAIKPADAIHRSDKKNVLVHGFFALGCAKAAVEILGKTYQKKRLPFIEKAYRALNTEVGNCEKAMFGALSQSISYSERLELRSRAIGLAGRCSQAAVTASSGAANYLYHPAGRVYREALVFSVSGQTTDVMEATLSQYYS